MKKTIRSSTFETNSSSTHVYSFSNLVKGRCDLTVIPDENNEIKISVNSYFSLASTVHPIWKMTLLLLLAKTLYNEEKVEQIKNVVESFTGAKLVVTGLDKIKSFKSETEDEDEKEDEYNDYFSDLFSGLDREYTSMSDHVDCAKKYLETEETVKTFIFCSKNSLGQEIVNG
jgi:hypothetical protein